MNKPQGMEHTTSSSQDASTQPLTGSALKALVRGWIAGTAGLPGDLEGLARKGVNWSFGPGGVNVDEAPALPTSDFYKDWLPGKQQGDEMINDIGSVFGGVGATKPVSLAKGALSRVAAAAPGPMAGSRAAMRGVIKAPGGNWLSGSVEDALKGLRHKVDSVAFANYTPEQQASVLASGRLPRNDAINSWIDKQLTKYVKNDMATERDPVRALAERGVLHYDADPFGPIAGTNVSKLRSEAGFPVGGSGKADLAKTWENVSDAMTRQTPMSEYQNFGSSNLTATEPWLQKLDPNTPMHRVKDNALSNNLGFNHLIDELRNAVNINSGLPAHLRLDPESLARVSVPQAVERVAKINDWRAAQKVAADQARANNAATLLHKDYPDKGFKWVELRVGDDAKLPGGFSLEPEKFARSGELAGYRVIGPDKKSVAFGKTEAEAIREANIPALKDALKYEGDTMGHCVGGYCDEVASGKSRIYSLRDAKGQPHTTIEVQPGIAPPRDAVRWSDLPEELQESMASRGLAPSEHELINTYFDPVKGTRYLQYDPRIVQIKGKANKAPNPEYLPYVQDFVKSGQWSDVGDLQNTGLRKSSDAFNSMEMEKLRSLGVEDIPQWVTGEDLNNLSGKLGSGLKYDASGRIISGYADGGSVRNALNAAVGGSGLVKAVGNTERAVGNIASGNASLGDMKSLRDMASQLGYTVPGLSQALGIAGVAKAGYNMASDPSGMNAAKLAATVNPIAAQALGLYQAATDPTPGTLVDAVSSFNPIARAYNGLANSFNFATIGQVMANLGKIADPNAPAQLRDMFSNNPNSAANAREANEMAARLGIDPMDAMMRVLNADEAAVPGPTVADAINAYNQAQALQTNPSLNPASPDFMGPQADGGSEGGYGYGGLGGIGGIGIG